MTGPIASRSRLPRRAGALPLAVGLALLGGGVLLAVAPSAGPATGRTAAGATATLGSISGSDAASFTAIAPAQSSAAPWASSPPPPSPASPATPVPSQTSQPSPSPSLDPAPAPGPFSIDLYRSGAFVSELKDIMCVPAAMQTIVNILTPGAPDRSAATQRRLYSLARDLSTSALRGTGAEPEGWARGLNQLGVGPYAVDVEPSIAAAVRKAALALRLTGRPVGLLVWRGAHSWVVSGFRATADPAWTSDFAVTGLYIDDVWYPRISTIWGASRPPDALVPVDKLGRDYLPWRRPTHRYPAKDGKYVLVIPTETSGG